MSLLDNIIGTKIVSGLLDRRALPARVRGTMSFSMISCLEFCAGNSAGAGAI